MEPNFAIDLPRSHTFPSYTHDVHVKPTKMVILYCTILPFPFVNSVVCWAEQQQSLELLAVARL